MSAFALENGKVYHTYSAYARGLDVMWGMYQWLDRAPLGRNETDFWIRRHDEYEPLADRGGGCVIGSVDRPMPVVASRPPSDHTFLADRGAAVRRQRG